MKTTSHATWGWILLLALAAPAAAAEPAGDGYTTGNYGRVRFDENGVTIRRGPAEPGLPSEDAARANSPVFPGDTLVTDPVQRAEVELADGTIVRIDRGSEVSFLSLPDPYADVVDNTVLQLVAGTVRIAPRLADDREFRIDTPGASVYLMRDGDVRIEVAQGGTTLVATRRGVAEVVGDGGSVLVQSGEQTAVDPGELPDDPAPFNTLASDGFDRWVAGREGAYASRDRYGSDEVYEQIPSEVQPYYRELSSNGRWIWVDDYDSYVWSPSYVSTGWRPYWNGYWSYGPYGYFWVSNDPWGWAPYHYGRWGYTSPYGWCWIPGRVFAGAWVAWSWGSIHFGWSALDYWNQPCYVSGYHHGYYDPGCWTFVDYAHADHHDYRRVAVPVHDVDLGNHTVVARPPSVAPRRLARSIEARASAQREARANQAARLAPPDRTARPARTMRDLERERPRQAAPTRAAAQSGREGWARRPAAAPSAPARANAPSGRSATDARVRGLYRQMASPRTTGNPSTNAAPTPNRSTGRPSLRPQAPRSTSSQPSARPTQTLRPQAPRGTSQPSARPSQTLRPQSPRGTSQPSARPSQTLRPQAPRATSQPSARPSQTLRPQAPRSSGQPSARPSQTLRPQAPRGTSQSSARPSQTARPQAPRGSGQPSARPSQTARPQAPRGSGQPSARPAPSQGRGGTSRSDSGRGKKD